MTKHYLYIKTDPIHYSLVGEFDSFNAATEAKNSTYPDKKFKILTEQAAMAAGQKQAKKAEQLEKTKQTIKEGAKVWGTALAGGAKLIGKAAVGGAKRAGEHASEIYEQHEKEYSEERALRRKAEMQLETELLPYKIQQEKLMRESRAQESQERRSLEFQRAKQLRQMQIDAELKAERERLAQRPYGERVSQQQEQFFGQERQTAPSRQYHGGPGYVPAPFQPQQEYNIGAPGQYHMPIYKTPVTSMFGGPEPVYQQPPKKKGRRK